MAAFTTKPQIDNAMINAVVNDKIWGEKTLQYLYGGSDALSLSDGFKTSYEGSFAGQPDAEFRFSGEATRAFAALSSVSGLTFEASTDASALDLVMVSGAAKEAGLEGEFDFPGGNLRAENDSWQLGVINSTLDNLTAEPETGGGHYGNWTIFHEIGHSVGLLHTHNDDTKEALPQIGVLDNERYSVMSYKGVDDSGFGHAVTYMALDIASLQAIYGKNESYAGGDSTYKLTDKGSAELSLAEGNMSIGQALACIWDTGGNDVIDYDGKANVVLNLNAATLDQTADLNLDVLKKYAKDLSKSETHDLFQNSHTAGGSFSFVDDQRGGYSIANGVMIEKASGGRGDDLLIGNEGDNELHGTRGNDVLFGRGGQDVLVGGKGADIFIYSEGAKISDFDASEGDKMVGDWPV